MARLQAALPTKAAYASSHGIQDFLPEHTTHIRHVAHSRMACGCPRPVGCTRLVRVVCSLVGGTSPHSSKLAPGAAHLSNSSPRQPSPPTGIRNQTLPLKGPRDLLKRPRGPLKGPWDPFKGPRGPFKGQVWLRIPVGGEGCSGAEVERWAALGANLDL